jgi:hypothetical protein
MSNYYRSDSGSDDEIAPMLGAQRTGVATGSSLLKPVGLTLLALGVVACGSLTFETDQMLATPSVAPAEFEGALNDGGNMECICDDGYQPDSTGEACEEIDPCRDSSDVCEHGECKDKDPPDVDYDCECHDGYFNDDTPYTCTPKECDPLTIEHSTAKDVSGYEPDQVYGVTCHDGYGPKVGFDTTCKGVAYGTSEWDVEENSCTPMECESLTIDNSQTLNVEGKETFETADVVCDPGYESSVSQDCKFQLECRAISPAYVAWGLSEWGTALNPLPTCDKMDCPVIDIPNAGYSTSNTKTGDQVTVTCDLGYHVSPGVISFIISCDGTSCDNQWNGVQTCTPIHCGEVTIAGTTCTGGQTNFYQPLQAVYQPKSLLLLGAQNFQPKTPAATTAPAYDQSLSGCGSTTTAVSPNDQFTTTCNNGYEPSLGGDSCSVDRVCVPDGNGYAFYDPALLDVCVRSQCPAFTVVNGEGGVYSEFITQDGEQQVTFTCRNGFQAAVSGGGSFTSICNIGNAPCVVDWNFVDSCECVDCTGLTISNSNAAAWSTCAETSVSVSCDDGYCDGDDGQFTVACEGTAPATVSWGAANTCTASSCPAVTVPFSTANGVTMTTTQSGEFVCADGYTRTDGNGPYFTLHCDPASVCASDWREEFECEPVPCPTLSIANSDADGTDTGAKAPDEVVDIQCASGFEPSSGATEACTVSRTCVPDGPGAAQWSGDESCNRVVCDAISGGYKQGSYSEVLESDIQIATVTCKNGYETVNEGAAAYESVCTAAGPCAADWSVQQDCQCTDCPVKDVANSDLFFGTGCTKDTVTANCDDGYCSSDTEEASFTMECVGQAPAVSAWEDVQTCERVSCSPITFANSNLAESAATGKTYDEATVTCDEGYASEDCTQWIITCEPIGPCASAWTNSNLKCEEREEALPADDVEDIAVECAPTVIVGEPIDTSPIESFGTINCPDDEGKTFDSTGDDLVEICLSIEHSYSADLRIILYCPNGQNVIMHAGGAPHTEGRYLGVISDEDNDVNTEVGGTYCFSQYADSLLEDAPTVAPYEAFQFPESWTLTEGTYRSLEDFSRFDGCPINGVWKLVIEDNVEYDNGYLFAWGLDILGEGDFVGEGDVLQEEALQDA